MDQLEQDDLALGNDNERMVVANLWSYWAHLSIYRFAVPFCRRRTVLDVGTGVGYGASYLADHEAQVHAVDGDPASIEHAARKYAGKPATFSVADLNRPLAFPDRSFDVVFSSNVFEHIANVDGLTAECARVVKPDGVVIVAVPPITVAWIAQDDMRNIHHVHHLPPAAWHAKLSRFFETIECHGHQGLGNWGELDVQTNEIGRWVDQTTIRETDFECPAVSIERLNGWQCITAIFVCREPRAAFGIETLAEREPRDWHLGAITAKIIAEGQAESGRLRALVARLEQEQAADRSQRDIATRRYEEVMASTIWRATKPLRTMGSLVKKTRVNTIGSS